MFKTLALATTLLAVPLAAFAQGSGANGLETRGDYLQAASQTPTPVTPTNRHLDEMTALGQIICKMDPYTELPPDQVTGHSTGTMQLLTQVAANLPTNAAAFPNADLISQIQVSALAHDYKFKIGDKELYAKRALYIPYRYPELDVDHHPIGWKTEGIVILYTGDQGGG
jgi:hypothetical protein